MTLFYPPSYSGFNGPYKYDAVAPPSIRNVEPVIKTQTNTTLRVGDVLLDGNTIKRCSKAGTVGPELVNTKVIFTGGGAYFTCDNPDDVKIGDYLKVNNYNCNVIAKVNNKIFVSYILYSFITNLPVLYVIE